MTLTQYSIDNTHTLILIDDSKEDIVQHPS